MPVFPSGGRKHGRFCFLLTGQISLMGNYGQFRAFLNLAFTILARCLPAAMLTLIL